MRSSEETEIQCRVVELLESYARPDIVWFAVPNGGHRFKRIAYELKRMGLRAGAPDLVFLVKGRFHGVELKAPHGRLEKTQEAFGFGIERAGGTYSVVFGFDNTVRHLISLDVFTPGVKFTFSEEEEQQRNRKRA